MIIIKTKAWHANFIYSVFIVCILLSQVRGQPNIPYIYKNVPIGATGAITGISIHPKNSRIMYMRNDGGGYRWDATNVRWICITDNLPIASGPEAFALDPNDTLSVYQMGATNGSGNFHKSANRGKTWLSKTVLNTQGNPIDINGNGSGKGANDRMMVDPNNSNVIYYASRKDGLLWSYDKGDTWHVRTFPLADVNLDEGPHFICGDKDAGTISVGGVVVTATLYVGIWGNGSGKGGVFKSTDGGVIWNKLPGPTLDWVWQGHITTNGTLYLTCNSGVAKYTRGGSALVDITPVNASGQYACVAVDLTDATGKTAIVTQYWEGNRNPIRRTVDGGTTWKEIGGQHSNSILFGEPDQFSIVAQGIAIDPADGKKVWLGDWVRPWYCIDVTAATPQWSDPIAGYEASTMINAYCPPSGCALFTTNYDIGGFRHVNINAYPANHLEWADGSCIDYCESDPSYMAYCGTNVGSAPSYPGGGVLLSTDNGVSWPGGFNNNSWVYTGGRVAVGATKNSNGKPVVVHIPQDSLVARYSTDWGISWNEVVGLPTTIQNGFFDWSDYLAADKINGQKFYAFSKTAITVGAATYLPIYRSDDGGAHWSRVGLIPYSFWSGHWMAYGASIRSQPGTEGKLWLNTYDPNNSDASDAGLFYSTDGGTNWVRVAHVKYPRMYTLGKAAPGRTNPTLYVWGTIKFLGVDKLGIWRSNDATALGDSLTGATWECICDPKSDTTAQQILSRAWNIAADRQTYGRIYFTTGGRGLWRGDDQTQNTVRANRATKPAYVNHIYTARITEKGLRITSSQSMKNVRIEIVSLDGRIMYSGLIQGPDAMVPLPARRCAALIIVKIGNQKMMISMLNVRK